MRKALLFIGAMLLFSLEASAQDIKLKEPQKSGGMPLMEAFNARRSGRQFSSQMLSDEHLSNLLWATYGISSDDGKRVVPTARNLQDIELYVLLKDGVYLYVADQNLLKQVGGIDLRPILAKEQNFALDAPVHLLFVTANKKYGDMHAGSMYQNAGLYLASVGLKGVVRGLFDRTEIKNALKLEGEREAVISMAVGYPKE